MKNIKLKYYIKNNAQYILFSTQKIKINLFSIFSSLKIFYRYINIMSYKYYIITCPQRKYELIFISHEKQ